MITEEEIVNVNREVPGAFQSMAYPAYIQCSKCGRLFAPIWHGEHKAVIINHNEGSECPNAGKKFVIAPFPVHTLELQSMDWIDNVRKNVESGLKFKNPLSRKLWGDKAVIVGACPSLDTEKEKLGKMKKQGYTIVCLIHALPCIEHMIDPDIVVIVDATDKFDDYTYRGNDIPLITSLMASPKLIKEWPGAVYGVVPAEDRMCGEELSGYAKKLKLPRVWSFQLSASFAGILARIMGITPEYMGCDMWFTKDQYYANPLTDAPPEGDEVLPDGRYPGMERFTSQRFLDKQKQADMIEGYFRINCDNLRKQIVE